VRYLVCNGAAVDAKRRGLSLVQWTLYRAQADQVSYLMSFGAAPELDTRVLWFAPDEPPAFGQWDFEDHDEEVAAREAMERVERRQAASDAARAKVLDGVRHRVAAEFNASAFESPEQAQAALTAAVAAAVQTASAIYDDPEAVRNESGTAVRTLVPDYSKGCFTKLVTDFHAKKNYTIDLRMLQTMCRSGYVVTKVHKVMPTDRPSLTLSYPYFVKMTNDQDQHYRVVVLILNCIMFAKNLPPCALPLIFPAHTDCAARDRSAQHAREAARGAAPARGGQGPRLPYAARRAQARLFARDPAAHVLGDGARRGAAARARRASAGSSDGPSM